MKTKQINKFIIEKNGVTIELTMQEAKSLLQDLKSFCNDSQHLSYPPGVRDFPLWDIGRPYVIHNEPAGTPPVDKDYWTWNSMGSDDDPIL